LNDLDTTLSMDRLADIYSANYEVEKNLDVFRNIWIFTIWQWMDLSVYFFDESHPEAMRMISLV